MRYIVFLAQFVLLYYFMLAGGMSGNSSLMKFIQDNPVVLLFLIPLIIGLISTGIWDRKVKKGGNYKVWEIISYVSFLPWLVLAIAQWVR